jgi:hypothetical protein
MRILYEGARYLNKELQLQSHNKEFAKILNTFEVYPCATTYNNNNNLNNNDIVSFPWHYNICFNNFDDNPGPCNKDLNDAIDTFDNYLFHNITTLPLLYECNIHNILSGSLIQLNLRFRIRFRTPAHTAISTSNLNITSRSVNVLEGIILSKTWRCPSNWIKENETNVALYFSIGYTYGKILNPAISKSIMSNLSNTTNNNNNEWIRFHNLHFQGGGCKGQMSYVWEAILRSKNTNSSFTCEVEGKDSDWIDNCLGTGIGQLNILPIYPI